MEKYIIEGGVALHGEVEVSGAKNAAVAIIPATILARGRSRIENIPNINDVIILLQILEEMGATVTRVDKTTFDIDTTHLSNPIVPHDLAKHLRASYYYIGALLGRNGEANVALPGGCDFGVRPIDQHIKGFEALGAEVSISAGMVQSKAKELVGAHVYFDVVSVGATINTMLAAVRAKGLTILENVAKEPHIVDLANFLNSMGADIRGAGTDIIRIHGVDLLRPTTYSIIPDQIEAGTYMVAAAATGGDVLITNVIPKHLESISDKLRAAGAEVEEFDEAVRVSRKGPLEKVSLKTMPHPGFPTDMQPQFTTMLSVANGTSTITEGVWDNRFKYVDDLNRMGANIKVDGKIAVVEGVETLTGAPVKALDLRAGAAIVIAGLMAEGITEVEDIYHVERGYEDFSGKIAGLGGRIRRVDLPENETAQAR